MDERERVESIATALEESAEFEKEGDEPAALGRLRQAISEHSGGLQNDTRMIDGFLETRISTTWLTLRAKEAFMSLALGQRDRNSHRWLALSEMASPTLPESDPELRFWMDRLRIKIALEHGKALTAAAWAFDLEDLVTSDDRFDDEMRLESLLSLAHAAMTLGFQKTADALYRKAIALPATPENKARAQRGHGSFLFDSGNHSGALAIYEDVIVALEAVESPTTNDLQEMARALRRRADCRIRLGKLEEGLEDSDRGLRYVELAREKGRYNSVRSVDRLVATDVDHLLDAVPRCQRQDNSADVALRMFLRASNSATAAALRVNGEDLRRSMLRSDDEPGPESGQTAIYLPNDSRHSLMQVRLSRHWAPIDECVIDSVRQGPPTLMIAQTGATPSRHRGFSLLTGKGCLAFHPWEVEDDLEGVGARQTEILRQLMRPPPSLTIDGERSAWELPANSPELASLAATILPFNELSDHLSEGLRVAPIGGLWNFPFACLPIAGESLGAITPIVHSVPVTANTPCPPPGSWVGHFDHSLVHTLRDQHCATIAAATGGQDLRLVDSADDLLDVEPISRFLFSGHGDGTGVDQRLLLANGDAIHAEQLRAATLGSSFMLNACWSGNVVDATGTDPVDLSLLLLAQGGHSVWAALGTLDDRHAAMMLEAMLRELGDDLTLSQAAQHAYRRLLDETPELPLRDWATHVIVGRSPQYSPP